MLSDAEMLSAAPDYFSVSALLKAHPVADGERRFVYFEAANEGLDQQNEVVLAKALEESASTYLRYGNVDIDHFTQIGARLGIPNYALYEIGQPVEVGQRNGSTFVKSEIYRPIPGRPEHAVEKANMVWAGLTEMNPPQRWYPSVGGSILQKSIEVDPKTQARKAVIAKVRWTNVGLSKTPVNQHVATCATIPVGTFAKSLVGADLLDLTKAVEAGYGTDSAALAGGAALRVQSLDRGVKSTITNYFDFRNKLSQAIRVGRASIGDSASELSGFSASEFGLSHGEAAEYVERFLRDLNAGLEKRKVQ